MSNFKSMKIRITSEAHNIAVQGALYNLGYEWRGIADRALYKWLEGCYGLYTDTSGKILLEMEWDECATEFANSPEEEYILTPQGKLMPAKDYFKQPSTAYCHGCNALTCPGGGCGDATEKTYAPLPLTPFSQWTAERMRLLAEHITEALSKSFTSDEDGIAEMAKELSVLAYLNKHFEKEVEQ